MIIQRRRVKVAMLVALLTYVGCAQLKQVLRTVDDIAEAACTIFGEQHPEEFAELVRLTKPALSPQVQKPGFDVGKLCDIKEVVQPFIDDQLKLQKRKALSLHVAVTRRTAGGDAALPEGVVQREVPDGGIADAVVPE